MGLSEPEADRGPHAGSPRGVVVATGPMPNLAYQIARHKRADRKLKVNVFELSTGPVATAPGSDMLFSERR